jgi:hypothetical protein
VRRGADAVRYGLQELIIIIILGNTGCHLLRLNPCMLLQSIAYLATILCRKLLLGAHPEPMVLHRPLTRL